MTLKPSTELLGFDHDTDREFSVTLLNTMLDGGSGPGGQKATQSKGKLKQGSMDRKWNILLSKVNWEKYKR